MTKRLFAASAQLICILLLPPAAWGQLPVPTQGWNLGNTLEAVPNEGSWGPAATQNVINAAAAAGFNTVRIPCAWDTHADKTTHTINPAFMARVKQIVDWCYAKNLYVIINCHWDGGWLENNITAKVDPTIDAKMHSYWTQIATTFKDYDSKLLFAGANEPNASKMEELATLMTYYQTFVDAVRAVGGNNTTRWLVVQAPNTNIDLSDTLLYSLPNDSTPGRLALEVHFYEPFQFSQLSSDASWGKMFYFWGQNYHSTTLASRNATWGEEDAVDAEFQKIQAKFVSRGIPVILGEYRASRRYGNADITGANWDLHVASVIHWNKYIHDSAITHGLSPIYWDVTGGSLDWTTGAISEADQIAVVTAPAQPPPPPTPAPPPTGSLLGNISTRSFAGSDSSTLIAGFIIQGGAPRSVLIRAGGPYLSQYGVDNVLADPVLTLYAGGTQIATNDDWGTDSTNIASSTTRAGAISFSNGSKDAAIAVTLLPGVAYTAQVSGKNGATGNAIVEVFDIDQGTNSNLYNISTRSYVGTGASIQIGGFILHGSGPRKVLIRAGGPYLTQYSVANVLADPVLTVYAGSNQIAQNDDWGANSAAVSDACRQLGVVNFTAGSKDSAMVLTLDPNVAYTAQVSGKNGGTGNALIEIFQLP